MARGRRKCPENGHRVHAGRILIAMANSDGLVVPVAIGDGEAICEKDQIKPATLENTCDLDVVLGRKERHGMRRVAPQRVAVRHRTCDQETRKVHSTPALAHDATRLSLGRWRTARNQKASRERNSEQRLRVYLTSSINIIEYQSCRHQDPGELVSRSWRSRSAYRILKLHDGFIVLNHYGAIPF